MKAMTPPLVDSPKHWLLGSLHHLRREPLRWIPEWFRRHGNLVALRSPLWGEVLLIGSPELAREILVKRAACYQRKSKSYGVLRVLMGNGLVTSEGDFWRGQRRLTQPAFQRRKIDALFDMKNERITATVAELRPAARSGQVVEVDSLLSRLTLDVISRAMFSTDSQGQAADVGKNIAAVNEWATRALRNPWLLLLPRRIPLPWTRDLRHPLKNLNRTVQAIIDSRRGNPMEHDDLLGMLLAACEEETGRKMNDTQLRDEVMTMFIAGHDTTANAMTWLLYLVSRHPEVEARMQAEIDANYPGDGGGIGSLESYSYTRQVIEEVLRLHPTIWSIGRSCTEDHEIGGYPIKAGTNVLIPIFHYHRSPEFWDNPLEFDPSRFDREKRPAADNPIYMPFATGPRSCIGNYFALQELMLLTIHFHRHYRFRVEPGFTVDEDPLITLRPKNGMRMLLAERQAASPQVPHQRAITAKAQGAVCPFSGMIG